MERKGGREIGARGQSGSQKARDQENEERASSPFYSGSCMPGCCQVTVGWSLDRMLTPCLSLLPVIQNTIKYFPYKNFKSSGIFFKSTYKKIACL